MHFGTYDGKAYFAPKEEEIVRTDGSLDPVQMARLAAQLLRGLLRNSTACGAVRYNIEAIALLWPYVVECGESPTEGDEGKASLSKEDFCLRMFTCPLTNGFFSVLAERQVIEDEVVALPTSPSFF